jgi:hypothetical protein
MLRHPLAVVLPFILSFQGQLPTPPAQPERPRVAVDARANDAVGGAFARALTEALRTSALLGPAEGGRSPDINVVAVSTPVRCEGPAISAIAIGAHRPGRVKSSQWVNVVISDEAHAREYADRVLSDLAAALITDRR